MDVLNYLEPKFHPILISGLGDTAGIGRMGPPRKIDLFLIDHFVIFSIRTIKMYGILVDYSGNVVLKKYMHAAIHWIIK